jgi:hypothetical protein
MIFKDRYHECQRCQNKETCKYSEIYYKNKGEWPIEGLAININNSSKCKFAVESGIVETYVLVEKEEKSYEDSFLFWMPNDHGYTSDLNSAGIWTKESAMQTTQNNKSEKTIAIKLSDLSKLSQTLRLVKFHNIRQFL